MATPTYTTDLNDITTAESITNWAELTGHTGGGSPTNESDYFIQGSYCVSQSTGVKTGTACGLQYDYGSDMSSSMNTGDCFFIWHIYLAANAIDTWANGGIRFGVGSSAGNMNFWNSVGKDFGRNPYGGWQNVAIDPTYDADTTDGTPTTAYQFFGSLPNILSAVSKGNPHGVDAIRYGRGDLIVEYGETADYATFDGMASTNDSQSNRWGLFSFQGGTYLWKGLISIGTASNAVNFVDSNRSIIVDDCPRTYTSFNKIEINNSNSVVTWNNIVFKALGTLSPGQLDVVDNADVNFDGCSFYDMDTFVFQSNSDVTNSIFQLCSGIDSGGGTFTGTKVLTPSTSVNDSVFIWNSTNNPDGYLDDMMFTKGANAHHAIEFGTSSPTTITLRGMSFTDFNASDNQNDSVLYIARTSGDVTIQAVECTGTITYKSAGANVTITQGVVTKIIVKDIDTGSIIEDARVLIKVADGSNFPYNDSVSITGSGTTATVTHTSHGLNTGDYVVILGVVNDDDYNGVYQITVSDENTYTYTTTETLNVSPATGTITATLALISGTTNINGEISDQRTMSSDQPIEGWVRKASGSPYYKQQIISDTVDSANGKEITILLIKDE